MNDIRNIVIAVLGVAIAVMVGMSVNKTTPPSGAFGSPILPSLYFGFGDVVQYRGKTTALTAATTTVCAIQAPTATSTLVRAAIRFDVSSTTASVVTLAKATTAFATTTSLGSAALAANAQGTIIATTTPVDALDEDRIFAPNTWFVVGMQGGVSGGTFSPTGVCQATWEAI